MSIKILAAAAFFATSVFAAGDGNTTLLDRVAALSSVKAHSYVPLKVESQGQLYAAYGYFDVAGRLPSDRHRKVFADMYLSHDLQTAVYGDGYNTQTGAHYTHTDMQAVEANEALTVGHGPLQIHLVTDPHCPFCKQFEKQLGQYADRATFHITLIALSMHREAPDAIRCILSKPESEREAALMTIADGKEACKNDEVNPNLHALQMEAMETSAAMLRVKVTPSLYLDDGTPLQMGEFSRMMADENITVSLK